MENKQVEVWKNNKEPTLVDIIYNLRNIINSIKGNGKRLDKLETPQTE